MLLMKLKSLLLVFLAKQREVHVAFGVRLQILKQGVGGAHRGVHIVVQARVVHEQTHSPILAIELVGDTLHIGNGLVDLSHSPGDVYGSEIGGES